MIKTLEYRNGKTFINGKPRQLAGSYTWGNVQDVVEGKEGQGAWERYLNEVLIPNGHNFSRLFVFEDQMAKPRFGTGPFYRRLETVIENYFLAGILPVVMLFDHHHLDGGQRRYGAKLNGGEQDHILKVLGIVKDYPVIIEVCNETPEEGIPWQQSVVDFISKVDKGNHIINVNTGFGAGGMSMNDLLSSGADSVSTLPGVSIPKRVLAIADTDHDKRTLSGNLGQKKSFFNEWNGKAALLHLESFPGSTLPKWKGSLNDPDNPSFPPIRKFLGRLADDLAEKPTPRPPKPEPRPSPQPGPSPEPQPGPVIPPTPSPPRPSEPSVLEELIQEFVADLEADFDARVKEYKPRLFEVVLQRVLGEVF